MARQKILIFGASGMLGSAVLRYFANDGKHEVIGAVRSERAARLLLKELQIRVAATGDVDDVDALAQAFHTHRPTVVINCIGLVKQLSESKDPLAAIPINAVLPHRLARFCALTGARLIHLSTDCVFSGRKGLYKENDIADAEDVYGRTKLLGEVVDYPHALTLRTSIIGHELAGGRSLVCWFLAQEGSVFGFSRAVFSGLPTVEIARVIHEYILDRPDLHGLYHLSADPIDKFSLLQLIKEVYGKQIDIVEDDQVVVDRSLDSSRFKHATGYQPEPWQKLIKKMNDFR